MAIKADLDGNLQSTALSVYLLAEAVVEFRRIIEIEYISADGNFDKDGGAPIVLPVELDKDGEGIELPPIEPRKIDDQLASLPSSVGDHLGLLLEHATILADSMSNVANFQSKSEALVQAAESMRLKLALSWLENDHRERFRNRLLERGDSEYRDESSSDKLMLKGSSLDSSEWSDYENAAELVGEVLPDPYSSIFELGRLLASVSHPLPSDYDDKCQMIRVFDGLFLQGELSPLVTRLMREVRNSSRIFESLPERFEGPDRYKSAVHLHQAILQRLKSAVMPQAFPVSNSPVPGQAEWGSIPISGMLPNDITPSGSELAIRESIAVDTTPAAIAPAPCDSIPDNTTPAFSALTSNENFSDLLKNKQNLDPNDSYIGKSLEILRVFHKIAVCRASKFRSVLLLGPKGSGKTTLAEIIHQALKVKIVAEEPTTQTTKNEKVKPCVLFRWQSSQSQASDAVVPRSQWLGFATKSSFQNVPPEGKAGLLKTCEGGTIFIDEFGDLHEDVQTVLLDVVEGRDVIPVDGGPTHAFKPNVNLIFATNKDVRTMIRADLLDRIRMTITLPPLNSRPEDIFPLVLHCLRETSFTLSIRTWALLLRHDWPGNVRELEKVIEQVRGEYQVRTPTSGPEPKDPKIELPYDLFLEVEELRETAARLRNDLNESAADCHLFNLLKRVLERQGYRESGRTSSAPPLYNRMAELLGMSRSQISKLKKRVKFHENK